MVMKLRILDVKSENVRSSEYAEDSSLWTECGSIECQRSRPRDNRVGIIVNLRDLD